MPKAVLGKDEWFIQKKLKEHRLKSVSLERSLSQSTRDQTDLGRGEFIQQ